MYSIIGWKTEVSRFESQPESECLLWSVLTGSVATRLVPEDLTVGGKTAG